MLLDNTELYDMVWDKVYNQLHFKTGSLNRAHSFNINSPFEIDNEFSVYRIENMKDCHVDRMDEGVGNVRLWIYKRK